MILSDFLFGNHTIRKLDKIDLYVSLALIMNLTLRMVSLI